MATNFTAIYDRFLNKITDDMYMELTPEDTVRDLQRLLINAIPEFEFPRVSLDEYTLKTEVMNEEDIEPGDFIIGVLWAELGDELAEGPTQVLLERSTFAEDLTSEEINILAILMMNGWLQR